MTSLPMLQSALDAVRKLSGPSGSVNEQVALALGWRSFGYDTVAGAEVFWENLDGRTSSRVPNFTGSLDTAKSVVPEGWSIGTLWEAYKSEDRPWWGCDLRRDSRYKIIKVLGVKSCPLALLAAALQARIADLETEGDKL